MLTEKKKARIRALSLEEMEHEINLGRKSRFQREAFAYLQTCYMVRRNGPISLAQPDRTPQPATYQTEDKHDPGFRVSPLRIAEGVLIIVLGACILYLVSLHLGISLK
jgi:hypothetical protein